MKSSNDAGSTVAASAAAASPRIQINPGDIFGGLAAMLVALPSAIAFGLVVYAPLGTSLASRGALAGIVGTVILGLIAPALGGAPRLVSAPCAPAAAVLAALVAELLAPRGGSLAPESVPLLLALVGAITGGIQFLFGTLKGGKLIKYIPYPVVAGYLSGVGVLIFLGQLPKFLGGPKNANLGSLIHSPALWNIDAILVGGATVAMMLLAPKLSKLSSGRAAAVLRAIPAVILALAAGLIAYFALGLFHPSLLQLDNNSLLIGVMNQGSGTSAGGLTDLWHAFRERWASAGALGLESVKLILVPAGTLAVLLSIDTLKTCVVVDAVTRSRHNSNRELIAQGTANFASSLFGGMPGAGTMGATLVNVNSGGTTRMSGLFAGVFALIAFLVLAPLVAWVPLSALAGILIVVAFRMVDRSSFRLLKHRSTLLDFTVILAVVLTAVFANLIAAAGVGLALAILLFLREQIRGSVVRRKSTGAHTFSKRQRLPKEISVLEQFGEHTAIFQLQGSLFFGTTDQLSTELEPFMAKCRYVIFDMKKVQSVDYSAVHLLELIESRLRERNGALIFADLPAALPSGQDLKSYFTEIGLAGVSVDNVKIFAELDDALEWTEDRILGEHDLLQGEGRAPLELNQIDMLKDLDDTTIAHLAQCAKKRSMKPGERIFSQGDRGDELFFIRKGVVRIELPVGNSKNRHLTSFSRGDFFGDMSFLDGGTRSANAVARTPTELFVVSRADLDASVKQSPALGGRVFSAMSKILATRLRHTNHELRNAEET